MLHDIFIKAIRQYEEQYIKKGQGFNVVLLIEEDLKDKGFSSDEIYDLTTHLFMDKNAKYKFLAYFCKLYDDYCSIDEMKQILIEQLGECDLSDEELSKIYNFTPEIS